jgi:hypothetical protein
VGGKKAAAMAAGEKRSKNCTLHSTAQGDPEMADADCALNYWLWQRHLLVMGAPGLASDDYNICGPYLFRKSKLYTLSYQMFDTCIKY